MASRARRTNRKPKRSSTSTLISGPPLAEHAALPLFNIASSLLAYLPAAILAHLHTLLSVAAEKRKLQLQEQRRPHKLAEPVQAALKKSRNGRQLISFDDLPPAWQGTPFIKSGYRFIPLERFSALLLSMFTPHNEFLNIQTHIVAFVYSCFHWSGGTQDLGETIVLIAGLFCLAASICGHMMSGCSDQHAMQFCNRVDYAGIAWLLCACNASLVFYGYASRPDIAYPFAVVSSFMALAGSILPFVSWFNRHEYRYWRISFFVALKVTAITPVVGIYMLYGLEGMRDFTSPFIRPIFLSALGIFFYTNHLPERFLNPHGKWATRFNAVGFGSHAIWHVLSATSILDWASAMAVVRHSFANRV
ncbi:IZH family channel protein [Mycena indigotica]|uniref:IZH family channel protein n=1 Tax=Mycena indigotica TaxID=2126181 RepID=A0A8H6TCP0_9AGAR|nr:IZH family channel protein [Mycena indigotica]KAF7315045.1 IZH family channel protein [Mycena indigotica]